MKLNAGILARSFLFRRGSSCCIGMRGETARGEVGEMGLGVSLA